MPDKSTRYQADLSASPGGYQFFLIFANTSLIQPVDEFSSIWCADHRLTEQGWHAWMTLKQLDDHFQSLPHQQAKIVNVRSSAYPGHRACLLRYSFGKVWKRAATRRSLALCEGLECRSIGRSCQQTISSSRNGKLQTFPLNKHDDRSRRVCWACTTRLRGILSSCKSDKAQ